MNIAEIRKKYPQYSDLSDMELAKGLHKKFYSDMDFGEFSQKIGLKSSGSMPSTEAKTLKDYFLDNLADIGYGAKKAVSGMTLGASDWALRKAGVNDEDYLKAKEKQGTKGAAQAAGFASEIGGSFFGAAPAIARGVTKTGLTGLKALATEGGIIGGTYGATNTDSLKDLPQNVALGSVSGAVLPIGFNYALKPVAKVFQPLINKYNQVRGLKDLEKQLAKGDGYSDVNLGNVSDDLATKINSVRNAGNVSPIEGSNISIPSDRVKHIYDQRIADNGYLPENISEVVDKALFGKNPNVSTGNYPQLQVVYDSSQPANKVVVGKHRDNGNLFVKTAMEDKSINKRGTDGHPVPSSSTRDVKNTGSAVELSAARSSNNNITPDINNVNSNYGSKSFVEALADKDKSRTLKNAVMAGEEGLAEKARILQDALERRKAGMYDENLENLIKIPELKTAEENYAKFINKQGDNIIPKAKITEYYLENPVAMGLVEEARQINPQAFSGVKKGSLKEFDILKQELRNSRSASDTIGKPRQDALKRAETSLKSLMDESFAGFRDVNSNLAKAKTNQDIFEGKLKKGLTSVGGATTSPFWSGISSPLAAAGAIGGLVNPMSLLATGGGLAGKAILRSARRRAGRDIAEGVIRTPANINPLLSLGLTGRAIDEGFDYNRSRRQQIIDLLNRE